MKQRIFFSILMISLLSGISLFGQEASSQLEKALSYKPVQPDVEIDVPSAEEIKQCEIKLYDGKRGFIITGPQKNTLRLFLDANGDGNVDQWAYFLGGVEVYRDIDADGNIKADQYRWLNSAGTRWGIDLNEDGIIDYWKMISAEEVSEEIVEALKTNDLARFLRVVLTKEDLKNLQLGPSQNEEIAKKIASLESGFAAAAKAIGLVKGMKWYQFSAGRPNLVPAGTRDNKLDLIVYENAIATVGNGRDDKEIKQISIGTLVKTGENCWKVLDLPKIYDENHISYTFVQPSVASVSGSAASEGNEVVALMREVQEIQASIPKVAREKRPELHKEVIARMIQIIGKSATNEDRDLWIRQLADTIMEAAQKNEFPQGGDQLKVLYETVKKEGNDDLAAHIRSRQITTDYYKDIFSGEDELKAHVKWLERLEEFATTFEKTEAGIEGMMQLASYREMSGKSMEEPIKWYNRVIELSAGKPIAEKAKGAIRRLTSVGKAVPCQGTDLSSGKQIDIASAKGNYLLLYFWDSRITGELAAVKAVADKNPGLKVVGINLDGDPQAAKAAIAQSGTNWPQLHAPGGFESPLAVYWGIQTTPIMVLYDKDGTVLNPNILSAEELNSTLTQQAK